MPHVPTYRAVIDLYGPPPSWSRPTDFVSLVVLILDQEVRIDGATATYHRLPTYLGEVTLAAIQRLDADE